MTTVNNIGFTRLNTEGELEFVPDALLDYITQDDKSYIIVLEDGRRVRIANIEFVNRLIAIGAKFVKEEPV